MDTVPTAGPSLARAAGTVIQVDGAEASSKALRAEAGEAVDAIEAGGAVSTRPHQTVVYILLTAGTHKARQAAASEVEGKALVVLAQPAILAWGAGVEWERAWIRTHTCVVAQIGFLTAAPPTHTPRTLIQLRHLEPL